MSDDRIDISDPLREIISGRLGLVYEDVASLTLCPSTLSATIYRRHDGKKYLEGDEAAKEIRTFRVTT